VVIDNRAGGGTLIASDALIKSPADGYTLMLSSVTTFSINQSLYEKLPYDPFSDFAPVSLTGRFPLVLVVGKDVPARSMRDLVALVKSRPQEFHFGSPGPASVHRLAMEMLAYRAGSELVHVPYKGGNPAMQDLLGGQVPSCFCAMPTSLPHIKAGKIRAIATTGPTRSPDLPNVPTVAESGFPKYEATNWYAFVAPAKVPRPILDRLNLEIGKALRSRDVIEQLGTSGMESHPGTADELARYIRRESDTWAEVVKAAGIRAE